MGNFILCVLGCLMLTYSCNGSMEEIVGELQREIQQLKMKTVSYERETQQLMNEMQALKISSAKEIQALKTSAASDIQALKTSSAKEIKFLKDEINTLKVDTFDGSVKPKRRFVLGSNSYAEKPAFSASLGDHATGLGNNQPIVFDDVFTNDLGGYSGLTGVFTAPVNGTYFFTATVMSHTADLLETDIALNGKTMVKTYSYDSQHEQGTNSVVVVLKTGDKVWVRVHNAAGTKAFGGHWSSFSGFMI